MIEINNLTTSEIDEDFLKGVAKKVLKGENEKEAGLSIVFVGQGRIRKLNKKYRGKNRVTDVLAFGQNQKFSLREISRRETKKNKFLASESKNQKFLFLPKNELGETIICLREVNKNAKKYHTNFKKELTRVLIHGILHLLGYDHEKSKKEAEEMEKKQEHYLSQTIT